MGLSAASGAVLVRWVRGEGRLGLGMGGQASEASSENERIEVDQQSDWNLRKPQVGDHLRFVDGQEALDGFELDQDASADDDVDTIGALQPNSLVVDRYEALSFEGEPSFRELAT